VVESLGVGPRARDVSAARGRVRREISIQVQLNNDRFGAWPRLPDKDDVPAGAAFEVDVLVDSQVLRIGSVPWTRDTAFSGFPGRGSPMTTRPFVPDEKRATVRLTPSRAFAESMPSTTWFHDGVIVFRDVPVDVVDDRSEKLEPLKGLKNTTQQYAFRGGWPFPWQR
jgi:hypothetical protein